MNALYTVLHILAKNENKIVQQQFKYKMSELIVKIMNGMKTNENVPKENI